MSEPPEPPEKTIYPEGLESDQPGRARPPTIRDVANRAGVATATVSNVLTGRRRVGEDTRRLVLQAVEALGYRANHLASSLRRQATRTIGIVVPDMTNPFFVALARRIEDLAAQSDYQCFLVDCNESAAHEATRIRALLDRMIDGLVIAPTGDDVAIEASLRDRMPPCVLIDRGFGATGFDTVAADNLGAAFRGCQHLIDLGHRDIALLVSARGLSNIGDRIEGYRRALAEAGLADRQRIITGGLGVDGCRAAIEQELRRADPPTAIFAVTHPATLGAIKAIRALDLAFPDDVSLLGFDDSDWMTVLRPYVSTIIQPIAEMSTATWQLLGARLSGDRQPCARVRLPCTVQVRESTRPPAHATRRRSGRMSSWRSKGG